MDDPSAATAEAQAASGPTAVLDAAATALLLRYDHLADELAALLQDPSVQVPQRLVQALPAAGGASAAVGSLFVMPALDARIAIAKLITLTPANVGTGRPTIQGDVLVFDIATGQRRLILDGPTVTARRTASVSLLAARHLARQPQGPMLVVGAGVQGRAHVEAFAQGLKVKEFWIASRSRASALALVRHAQSLGAQAWVCEDPSAALAACPLVATCTPAQAVVLRGQARTDAFIAAVGAFTPRMVELEAELCRHIQVHGCIVIDTPDAAHEAGDLIQAGIDMSALPSLADVVRGDAATPTSGPVLFKSCGWAGWDLAAARLSLQNQ
jgi:1-piperideine-2-carboxylate/1-pyrroline-2-carboxylate reductase [NAD(P)H]